MKQHDSLEELKMKIARSVRMPALSKSAYLLGWAAAFLLLIACVATTGQTSGDQEEFVRQSAPELLTFDELVQLEKTDDPSPQLAARLEQVLHTPFLSNEAFYAGAQPNRPSSEALGPFLRATTWNIERGIEFEGIRISLAEPDKFEAYIQEKKDAKSKPLTAAALAVVKSQLDILKPTDLFILNEVDDGVTRTDYRDVGRELAQALHMNYAYAVEFLEIDPLNLGLEQVKMADKDAQADIQKSFEPDKSRYLGLHGTAVLSRYPIRKATIRSLPVCYDWFLGEKKAISKLESGKRASANLVFMERITREVRRGGRTTLFVELAVPESPTGAITVVAPHLETKCKPECRRKQMAAILEWIKAEKNPVILAGDFNTSGTDTSPTSVSKVITNRLKDPDKWAVTAIKWSTGAPTILLVPVNIMRNKNDPTGFDLPLLSRKKEAKLFGDLNNFRFDDGNTFDFRGENARSADNRGGTLSDSNQRATKGFRYTFALARTYGGLFGEYKLDWVFVKGYATDSSKPGGSYKFSPNFARTLQEVNEAPDDSLSDHFPITVDVPLTEPARNVDRP
ncbi:MAG TPA: endonuclease/exonuclease/phosphatase family protein [Candidatus Acidoferrum sp.]|jgi:endonuclease/exonuclease/phosphatase family metal-dependent hydrolase|nr:endonuclease/exonuclease/phosphatase family protein [Candidatus Acidoferrum sp.]